jgi:Plasmid pRiA4b ORF-3-like protein
VREAVEYTHPDNADEIDEDSVHDAADTTLRDLGLVVGQRILYLFDFGDEWWHEVTVERIDAAIEKGSYPRLVDQRGESPPQYSEVDEDDVEEEDE